MLEELWSRGSDCQKQFVREFTPQSLVGALKYFQRSLCVRYFRNLSLQRFLVGPRRLKLDELWELPKVCIVDSSRLRFEKSLMTTRKTRLEPR